jgi:hypothetical protein
VEEETMPYSTRVLITLCCLIFAAGAAWAADAVVQLGAGDGFVVQDSAATERLRVDEQGNLHRNGQLFVHDGGVTDNTYLGNGAGANSGATAIRNTGFGFAALNALTSGDNNSAFGYGALDAVGGGVQNSAFGSSALQSVTTGSNNSAFGTFALQNLVIGVSNTAVGAWALSQNTASNNAAFGEESLASNTTGADNVAVGSNSLTANVDGDFNVAVGSNSLSGNVAGNQNTAMGHFALAANSAGGGNAAVGYRVLQLGSGSSNAGFGADALQAMTTGDSNTALGANALRSFTSGNGNVAVGVSAGINLTSGDTNLYLGSVGPAVAGPESNVIRIGGLQTKTFVAGISGNGLVNGAGVLVTGTGELGVLTSSGRFKSDVRDLGDPSSLVMGLRPVSFRYTEAVAGSDAPLQYGLIAEEVAEVAPELVVYDEEGAPFSVRYQELAPLLLGEVQQQRRTIDRQSAALARQRERLQQQQQLIEALAARVEALERGPEGKATRTAALAAR